MLEKSLPFQPRATMRLMEMRARFEPARAEELLAYARRYSSTKYESLALWHLGSYPEAATIAARAGSDLLLAQVGHPQARRGALDRIVASLEPEVRATFLTSGRLCVSKTTRWS